MRKTASVLTYSDNIHIYSKKGILFLPAIILHIKVQKIIKNAVRGYSWNSSVCSIFCLWRNSTMSTCEGYFPMLL
ncbi:hypothetical protein CDAR_267841 [Caerostris darwini]|uniref:Uncharacterized protein n=1 Tax=Caerostris darwini TaxID=1538125 RepID=A0AAV4UGW1_9ARAC|nr:hypothetical protein CDAR_267841 [Caerostris darwini]